MADPNKLLLEFARLQRKLTGEGLTVKELERRDALKYRLSRHFSPGLDAQTAERRRSPRISSRLHCSFESFGTLERALITNVSQGGVFIKTVSPLPIGTELRICIRIAETEAQTELPGKVVSHNVGPSCNTREAGMGVAFMATDTQIVKQINELYGQAIQRAVDSGNEQRQTTEKKPRRG
jgi:Tfp pilus assembly protein PilZ